MPATILIVDDSRGRPDKISVSQIQTAQHISKIR